jgi:hypothetical protein
MQRKQVYLLLTQTGLVLRKVQKGASRIHHVMSLYHPCSFTPSDTLSIGLHGMVLCNQVPTDLTSQGQKPGSSPRSHGSSSVYARSSASMAMSEEDWVYIETKTTGGSPGAGSDRGKGKSRFLPGNHSVEIAFSSKEELDDWMEAIMTQYEAVRI